jgi:hypothetical protein
VEDATTSMKNVIIMRRKSIASKESILIMRNIQMKRWRLLLTLVILLLNKRRVNQKS